MGTFKNFANFTRKIHVLESVFKKASGPQACKFIKKKPQHRYFPVELARFSKALFLQNTSGGWFLKKTTVTICSKIFQGYFLLTTNLLSPATRTVTNFKLENAFTYQKLVPIKRFCNRFRTISKGSDLNINNFHFRIT